MKRIFGLFLLIGCAGSILHAQQAPFASEIQAFSQQDNQQPPPAKPVLFVGSSSIRLWSSLKEDFKGKPVLNRGFGGAAIPDVVRYAEETIFRYKPSRIIFYCGENDLAASDTVSARTVVHRFTNLFGQIRQRLPNVPFVFISIKPSPSRAHLMGKVKEANAAIRTFLQGQPNTTYIDVFTPMLNKEGRPRPELFTADSLHMNALGYTIWRQKIQPVVK